MTIATSNPTERPIVFNTQEVIAVSSGCKTQHRVPIKMRYGSPEFLGSRDCNKSDPSLWGWDNFEDSETRVLSNEPCPFGAIGDRLWVREFHARTDRNDHLTRPHYYADGTLRPDLRHDAGLLIKYSAEDMPRWASRILLEITDIRIERVQDITAMNAQAEGSPLPKISTTYFDLPFHQACCNLLEWFKRYWNEKHSKLENWESNPWVWVIEFK